MLIEEMLATYPDMRPKEVLQTLIRKRKVNENLEKVIKEHEKKIVTIKKQLKKEYSFPRELIPELSKVSRIN